jgi:hypothetical protein
MGNAVHHQLAITAGHRAAVMWALAANGLILVLVVAATPAFLPFAAPIAA